MSFTGRITSISEIRSGENNGKEWASLEFEVAESNPNNESYPQIANFGYFKNGEYAKYAKEFNSNFSLNDEVEVDYNFKCVNYEKNGEKKKFYKVDCWKVVKTESSQTNDTTSAPIVSDNEPDDLPF